MPKKSHGRPSKAKSRSKRSQRQAAVGSLTPPDSSVAVSRTGVAPAAAPAVTPTRRASTARKAPTLTVNYSYLRHDLLTLSVLAPLMVVLLVGAFVALH